MKLELFFEEIYPHPIEKVWRALTEPAALASWLMPNDFEARVGKRFTFRNEPQPGWRGRVDCEVIALEPPVRMVWSWLGTDEGDPTQVEFRLEAVEGGTRLTLAHTGATAPAMKERLGAGWPRRLAQLRVDLPSTA
ncbi:MAG TPA: SRPBCC domain-containing protein [Candidatus Binataceae bacterium]|nr:SRPBCC domain-containing protein [Candidatus Binataceae bacterium]